MAHYYKPDDFQCRDPLTSPHPYESTKYQCELAAIGLHDVLKATTFPSQPSTPSASLLELKQLGDARQSNATEPQSFICHPGVVASSIFAEYLNVFMAMCMKLAFYMVSRSVQYCTLRMAQLTFGLFPRAQARWTFSPHHPIEPYKGAVAASHVALAPLSQVDPSKRYGSRADFWGREYVHAGRLDGWDETPSEPGQRVRQQARDLIVKLEGVASKVWSEAREGSLAPFADLVLPSRDLSSQLLPQTQRRMADSDEWERVDKE